MAKANRSSRGWAGRLKTQKDGRIFAYRALERLQKASSEQASAYPYPTPRSVSERGDLLGERPFRDGPQWDGFYRDLSSLFRSGSEEARKGFASIFSDALAGSNGINMDVSYYRELERAGCVQEFGRPGTDAKAFRSIEDAKPAAAAKRAKAA